MSAGRLLFCLSLLLALMPGGLGAAPDVTAPFAVRQMDGRWWLLDPEGSRFFSRGVCCVHQGTSRDTDDPENPSYAAWRHHRSAAAWAGETLSRLKAWNFTTLGGWSDFEALRQSPGPGLFLTPVLHLGSTAGAPWWDMWDPQNLRRMEDTAREQITRLRGEARVIGYYSDNELGWWNATLWKMTLEQPATSGQRRRLVEMLRETYARDWPRLTADFEPENAANWDELGQRGMLYLRPGGRGIAPMREFLGVLAERYYSLMREIIRRHDPRALYLGDRYQSFFYPEVARAAGRHVDVISSNLNAHWSDGTFLRCYLETLHQLSGRPVLVSEFYLAATENRSGNRNSHGTYPVVPTQAGRAAAARRTLEGLARLPYVVGADWFQYFDEPRHGRDDGENFNFGLTDIHDRPYAELTGMFASLNLTNLHGAAPTGPGNTLAAIPPAPSEPLARFKPPEALGHWDRERGFVKPSSGLPLADLYACWSPKALYLGLYSLDIVEAAYYRGSSVPKADRALWTVRVNGRELVRARLGAGREPLGNEPRVRIENVSGLNHNVSNIAAMEIPAALLGRDELRPGDTVELSCTLLTHFAAHQVDWSGTFALRR